MLEVLGDVGATSSARRRTSSAARSRRCWPAERRPVRHRRHPAGTERRRWSRPAPSRALRRPLLGASRSSPSRGCREDPPRAATSTRGQVDAVEAPELGACRVLTPDDVAQPSNATRIVDCARAAHRPDLRGRRSCPPRCDDAAYDDPTARARSPTRPARRSSCSSSAPTRASRCAPSSAGRGSGPREQAWDDGRPVVPLRRRRRRRPEQGSTSTCPTDAKGLLLGKPDDRWLVCASGRHGGRLGEGPVLPAARLARGHHDQARRAERPLPRRPARAGAAPATTAPSSVGAWLGYPVDYDFGYTWFHEAEWKAGNRRRSAGRGPTHEARSPSRPSRPSSRARALAGCSGGGDGPPAAADRRRPSPSARVREPRRDARPARRAAAAARGPAPATGSTYDEAVAPTSDGRAGALHRARTPSMTYAVGTLDTVVDGHLLAVDSRRVQAQVARTVPAAAAVVPRRHRRGPAAEHAARGVVHPDGRGVRRRRRLVPLRRDRAGRPTTGWPRCDGSWPASSAGADGRDRFAHVRHRRARHARTSRGSSAASAHSWRAVRTVPLAAGRPRAPTPARPPSGPPASSTCKDAASAAASRQAELHLGLRVAHRPAVVRRARRTVCAGCPTDRPGPARPSAPTRSQERHELEARRPARPDRTHRRRDRRQLRHRRATPPASWPPTAPRWCWPAATSSPGGEAAATMAGSPRASRRSTWPRRPRCATFAEPLGGPAGPAGQQRRRDDARRSTARPRTASSCSSAPTTSATSRSPAGCCRRCSPSDAPRVVTVSSIAHHRGDATRARGQPGGDVPSRSGPTATASWPTCSSPASCTAARRRPARRSSRPPRTRASPPPTWSARPTAWAPTRSSAGSRRTSCRCSSSPPRAGANPTLYAATAARRAPTPARSGCARPAARSGPARLSRTPATTSSAAALVGARRASRPGCGARRSESARSPACAAGGGRAASPWRS